MKDELTDMQWSITEQLMSKQKGPRKPRADDRETLNAILYVLNT